jgi:hypothetical protein
MRNTTIFWGLCIATVSAAVVAQPQPPAGKLVLPTPQEAKQAIVKMMDMAALQNDMSVKLGTCIPAVQAKHVGQVACTLAVKLGAGTSETQADFYRTGGKWVAQPSVSQDKLPFPDPAL